MPQKRTVFVVVSIVFFIAILLVLLGLFVYPGWIKIRRVQPVEDSDEPQDKPQGPVDMDFLQKVADEDEETIKRIAEVVKKNEEARKTLAGQELVNYNLLCTFPPKEEMEGRQPMCTRALAANEQIPGCWADCMAAYYDSCNKDKTCLLNIYGAIARNETGGKDGIVTLQSESRQTHLNSISKYFVDKVKTRAAIDTATFNNLKFRTKSSFITPKQLWDATRFELGLVRCPTFTRTEDTRTPRDILNNGGIINSPLGDYPARYTISNKSDDTTSTQCYTSLAMSATVGGGSYTAVDRCGDNFEGYETLSKTPWTDKATRVCSDDVIRRAGESINRQVNTARDVGT